MNLGSRKNLEQQQIRISRAASALKPKKKSDYEPMYSVKDPHLELYNQVRKRDKSKEI